jgi:membrane-associated phospholipid phosphatase
VNPAEESPRRRPGLGGNEVTLALGAYAAYLVVRWIVWTGEGRARALANAQRVVDLERRLGLDIERGLQDLAVNLPGLLDVLNAGYALGNVSLSVGWLMILFGRRDSDYLPERRAMLTAFAVSLPVFALVPTAPPRRLDGFVDTLAERGWSLDNDVLVRFYNPIAALPSQHVAFAVITGWGLARRAGSAATATLWRLYPVAIALVVMATGNHFLIDVIAGAVIGVTCRACWGPPPLAEIEGSADDGLIEPR